jgi:hypothetical protein
MENQNRVRVSIANLAWRARIEDTVRSCVTFGILNPKKMNQIMALGGGAMLKVGGKTMLEEVVGATHFEFDEQTRLYDARFQIDAADVNWVFKSFSDVTSSGRTRYENDPRLDIRAELSGKEFPGYPTILTADEVRNIRVGFLRVVYQKLPAVGADTSDRAKADMPTHRMFRIFELVMPIEIWHKFVHSAVVRVLVDEELATTDGGSKAGKNRDGLIIQNNLFLA